MAKRAKLEIMRDILKIIKENNGVIKPTPLLRKAGLSSGRFKEYYKDMLEKKLVTGAINENLNKQIILTEKGNKFLERYRTIIEFIDEFDL
jgi:predicted transcriptional regulator